jgi:hypothetical protein
MSIRQLSTRPVYENSWMRVRKVRRDEWEAMLRDGEIKDAPSIAAYELLRLDNEHG